MKHQVLWVANATARNGEKKTTALLKSLAEGGLNTDGNEYIIAPFYKMDEGIWYGSGIYFEADERDAFVAFINYLDHDSWYQVDTEKTTDGKHTIIKSDIKRYDKIVEK